MGANELKHFLFNVEFGRLGLRAFYFPKCLELSDMALHATWCPVLWLSRWIDVGPAYATVLELGNC